MNTTVTFPEWLTFYIVREATKEKMYEGVSLAR